MARFCEDGSAYIAALLKRGFREIGSGAYSTVLAKPGSDRVVKVLRRDLDAWGEYVHWATTAGFAGSFAPKVYSFKLYSGFYVAIMERLGRCIDCHADEGIKTLFNLGSRYPWDVDQSKEAKSLNPQFHHFMIEFRKRFEGYNLDLHGGNWMTTENNSGDTRLVLVDPIASQANSTTPIRWRVKTPDYRQFTLPGI